MKGNLTELKKQYEALGEEIKKLEDSSFVPGWYMYWDNSLDVYHIEYVEKESMSKSTCWDNIVPVTQELLNKFLPKKTTMYNWSEAPDWAQWAATDANGSAFWYEAKPYAEIWIQQWLPNHKQYSGAPSANCLVSWKVSLEERPHDR